MTQTQIEQTRVIYLWSERNDVDLIHDITPIELSHMPYLTDLNALHKVAMNVADELKLKNGLLALDILTALSAKQINGEYIDLFNAVYNGIIYLHDNRNFTTRQSHRSDTSPFE
jgi:hypothetical protein